MSQEPAKQFEESLKLHQESLRWMVPGGTSISKMPELYPMGAYPIYLKSASGCHVEDVDGNTYIDLQGAIGANLLGYAHPHVTDAVIAQAQQGSLLPLAHPLVVEVSRKLCEMVPCAERVRLLKNGSDATSAAVRLARAYTGRDHIACCHFHGWHDSYCASTGMGRGIPAVNNDLVHPFKYNEIATLEAILSTNPVAAVIMEPVHLDLPDEGYLEAVQELCQRHGTLLIFDEVVTGFRFGNGGAQELFDVTPDLCCFGKALSNGYALSAVCGSAEIIDQTADVITSMTLAEEATALAAANATLDFLKQEPVHERIAEMGFALKGAINWLAQKYDIPITCKGLSARMELEYEDMGDNTRLELKGYFLEQTAQRGVLFGNMIFLNYFHKREDLEKIVSAVEQVFVEIIHTVGPLPRLGAVPKELW